MPVEFRILGPLEVLVDGRVVALGGTRQRAVLAILVLHRDEVVSVDRLIDALWGERPPATAKKTVQVYVSRLRKELGEGMVATRGGGYVLEARPEDVDVERFTRLAGEGGEALERGDPDDASELLAEALALWRGPPLADLAYESFAQNEIARLEEGRLVAIEDRIDADLALRRHEALIAELERLIADHPTRERLRAQLMLALYRSGRQAEALETYREARRELDRELGLEPGPELQELERAILNQDPAIAAPPRRGSLADLRTRRRGALAIAFGGGLLLAAAVAAILAGGDGDPDLAEPNTLAVIDPESGELVDTIPTGVQPVAVATDGTDVWVANAVDDNLTRIDADERAVVGTVPAEVSIGGIAAGDRSALDREQPRLEADPARPDPGSRQTTRLAAVPEELSVGSSEPRHRRLRLGVGGKVGWGARPRRWRTRQGDREDRGRKQPERHRRRRRRHLARRRRRQHGAADRPPYRRGGDRDDAGRSGTPSDRCGRGRGLGGEHRRRHGHPARSRDRRGDGDDRGRLEADRDRNRRRLGLGREQPRRHGLAYRRGGERGRGHALCRRGTAGGRLRERPGLGQRPGERRAARRPGIRR